MKVLILGSGCWYQNHNIPSQCHSCMTIQEYKYILDEAIHNGQLVTLDSNPDMQAHVIATVYEQPWAQAVKEKYGTDFDVIIDEIKEATASTAASSKFYEDEAAKLLSSDGLFYGWKDGQKVKWFNTTSGLQLSQQQ